MRSIKQTILLIAALMCATTAQELSDNIVIDQFGYREQAKKVAVARAPLVGIGAPSLYVPGSVFEVVSEASGNAVFSGAPISLNSGQTDAASGDKIWWFDFSSVKEPGRYYIVDRGNNLRSFSFKIADNVYEDVLKAAIRMFYYQRAGTDKPAQYAGADWADGMCFAQDRQTRSVFAKNDASTARDLSGGWFDAGDFNKYTKWTADYISTMLLTYDENPLAFKDNYGIPESGNGVPDILDEAKWGISWLLKMHNSDGSVLSVQGLAGGSPPSSVTEPSYYGPPNTTATLGTATTFAIASRVFSERGEIEYAEKLKTAALKAWEWASAHPDSMYSNSGDKAPPGFSLAAGNQEVEGNDNGERNENRATTAYFMYELTGEEQYLTIAEELMRKLPLFLWYGHMDHYRHSSHLLYMRYLQNPNIANSGFKNEIRNFMLSGFASNVYHGSYGTDGYRSYINQYNWGSNKAKADYGETYYKWSIVNPSVDYKDIAEEYLHYIHGVNPFNMVYLTSMGNYGASKHITTIFHSWFDGENSQKWGKTANGNPGPAPGFLAGGPNQYYKRNDCCNENGHDCWGNRNMCSLADGMENLPPAKMYADISYPWILDPWTITEPSNGYQLSYIRLLSKFVENGSTTPTKKQPVIQNFKITQSKNSLQIFGDKALQVSIYSVSGKLLIKQHSSNGKLNINLQSIPNGVYIVQVMSGSARETRVMAR